MVLFRSNDQSVELVHYTAFLQKYYRLNQLYKLKLDFFLITDNLLESGQTDTITRQPFIRQSWSIVQLWILAIMTTCVGNKYLKGTYNDFHWLTDRRLVGCFI